MSEFLKKVKESFIDPYDEDEEDEEEVEVEETASTYEKANNTNVKATTNAKMVIHEPRSYEEDAKEIANNLLQKKACVVNIHRLQAANSLRLLDFLAGVTYAIGGSIEKIDQNAFLFAPKELPVDGKVESDNE